MLPATFRSAEDRDTLINVYEEEKDNTEPTIFYEFAYDTAILAQKEGIKNLCKQ